MIACLTLAHVRAECIRGIDATERPPTYTGQKRETEKGSRDRGTRIRTTVEKYQHGPSGFWLGLLRCENASAAPTKVKIFHPPNRERLRRTRDYLRLANRRVPWQLVHLWKMNDVLVVKGGILGIESWDDGRVEGDRLCHDLTTVDSEFFLWGNAALKYIIGNWLISTHRGLTDLSSDKGH
jgi:hypothetical protein